MLANGAMIELWNGESSTSWSVRPELYDAMLGGLGDRVLAAAALLPGERVLDVGCGAGQLAVEAADLVGSTGSVLATDVATSLLALTASRAADQPQLAVLEADAQEHAFPAGSFDVVISRFGVMFFEDPVRAFENLHAAVVPGGRMAFVAWQAAPLNEWVLVPLLAVMPIVGPPALPPPGAPGPFAFGDADHVRAILGDAGWADVEVQDIQTSLCVGGAATAEEAVDFTANDTFGRMVLGGAAPEQREQALAALRAAYAEHVVPEGVVLKAAVWVVTARKVSA